MEILITLAIVLFSAIVHEVSHGLMAEKLGDSTARDEGRITLNPIPHIDPFGSILLPAFMLWATGGQFALGAAKPVPVNFNNLHPKRWGMALVSLAGPFSNIILAILFILPVKFGLVSGVVAGIWLTAAKLNVILAVFNILPIPPLDGSKILASLLPYNIMNRLLEFEQYGFTIVIILLFLGVLDKILMPVLTLFFRLFGVSVL